MNKLLTMAMLLLSVNLISDVKYYEEVDAFTDEKNYYMYGKAPSNSAFAYSAYFKITLSPEGYWMLAFNSEYFNFGISQDDTIEMKARFDKNPPLTVNTYYCSQYPDYLEDCRVSSSDRDPSNGFFTLDYAGFVEQFLIQAASSKKLLLLFPGEQPLEFDLSGYQNAAQRFNSNFAE